MIPLNSKVVVIGGGAAGMMAAAIAASRGIQTILYEKNYKLGKKIYLTGKGRCNLTNQCDIEETIENIPGNGRFLYSALYALDNYRLRELFHELGLPTKVERGNRVFPLSDKSSDVIRALENFLTKHNVRVHLNKEITNIQVQEGRVTGVCTRDGDIISSSSVVIATGGLSYPTTGSTGDGYRWAKELGHTIIPLRPSLVSLETDEDWIRELQGLTLKNVRVKAVTTDGKNIREEFGEMMFTHFGISGPIVLTVSRFVYDWLRDGIKLYIDLKPALSHEKLNERMLRDFSQACNKQSGSCLDGLLPKRLAAAIMKGSGIELQKRINQITRQERQDLVNTVKGLEVNIKSLRPYSEAVVTAGGISTKEVNPRTMESKLVKGLMFAGEVLDVDGLTGGFNLQIAFSTGYLAGMSCE